MKFFILLMSLLMPFAASGAPSIVLITVDTLRADRLGCYGYSAATSPTLDRLAKESALFWNAYAPAPLTLPSHASILTGNYPAYHGIRDNAHFARLQKRMIQQELQQKGYRTAAFVSGAPLAAGFGLTTGFDYYDDDFDGAERRADVTTDRALLWMKEVKPPYFAWIHYFDPHAGYDPPESYRKQFTDPYDGEIAFVDAQIDRILQQAGKDAVIVVTADHGESLGDHGENTHGVFLYNSTLRVPLLIRAPKFNGIRQEAVSLCDLFPTILELAGFAPPSSNGISLRSKKKNRYILAESLYAQRNFGYAPLYAVILGQEKYIDAPEPEFFDLRTDPAEKNNLAGKGISAEWKGVATRYSGSGTQKEGRSLSPEEEEQLRSLGYIAASLPASPVDPKNKTTQIEQFNTGMGLLQTEKYAEAENSFRKFTQTERNNCLAFRFLGDSQSAQQKYSEAVESYLASYKCLADPGVAVRLAKAYSRTRQISKAEDVLLETVRRFPDFGEAKYELASLYSALRKWDAALNLLNENKAESHNQRGILYLRLRNPEDAAAAFRSAIALRPRSTYWNNLGVAAQQLSRFEEAEFAYRQGILLNPVYQECEANLAVLLAQMGKWEEALERLTRITKANPHLLQPQFALGYVLENLNRYGEAEEIFRRLLKEAPEEWPLREQTQQHLRSTEQKMLQVEEIK